MRGGRPVGMLLAVAAASLAGIGAPVVIANTHDDLPPRRRRVPVLRRSSGGGGGKQHEHKREIARRLRQAERNRANREARGIAGVMGFSRTHLTCYAYAEGKVFRGRKQVQS